MGDRLIPWLSMDDEARTDPKGDWYRRDSVDYIISSLVRRWKEHAGTRLRQSIEYAASQPSLSAALTVESEVVDWCASELAKLLDTPDTVPAPPPIPPPERDHGRKVRL